MKQILVKSYKNFFLSEELWSMDDSILRKF